MFSSRTLLIVLDLFLPKYELYLSLIIILSQQYIFQFKIREDKFMENDESIFQLKTTITEKVSETHGCKHYQKGQYEVCLKAEIQRKFNETIKCTPPWFTKEYKQVSIGPEII